MNKFCLLIACFFAITVSAQEKLILMGKASDMYVIHSASGKENLQTISNGFGLSLKKLTTYNKININSTAVLPKGTKIKIPLTKDNLLQHRSDNSAPVCHIIKKGENLYRLSQAYNKVPLASIREWNQLKKDAVKNGQQVIIGYMVNAKVPAITEKKTDSKKESVALNTDPVDSQADKKTVEKKEPVITPAATKELPANNATTVQVKELSKIVEHKPLVTEAKKKEEPVSADYSPKEGDEGYFASGYADHGKNQAQQFHSGDAAIFKTISGWTDRKFYVLMNDVAPKTVVRITAPGNKSICAMVLGPLQETKGANGLLLRLSNSAASALGLTDPKFTVTVTYFE